MSFKTQIVAIEKLLRPKAAKTTLLKLPEVFKKKKKLLRAI